ncbi:MAG: hypothetical protein JNM81_08885 [Rhodospirillaceae bacterium]|nr:hypothetical protein [Rhodospirillaceae bacterium]
MTALGDFFLSKASGRRVVLCLALVVLSILIFNLILTPMYQTVSAGFVPFDLQFPLTREMIVIQLGAMSELTPKAYLNFAILDFAFPFFGATFFVLFWAWLVAKSRSAMLTGFYRRGWWIWAIFPCLCDWAENVAFLSILFAHPIIQPDTLGFAIDAHKAKMVFMAIAQAMSVALLIGSGLARLRSKSG